MLLIAKIGLPVFALALLTLVVMWPEISRLSERTRMSFHRVFSLEAENGRMIEPHYRGVDQRGRPYTMTASWAKQIGPNQVELGQPKGDIVLESGNWMQVEGDHGVFIQHTEMLDLSGNVTLYRDDGTVLRTETAEVDLKQGAASSSDMTHAEGPFGVLDAQGFTLVDKGAGIQFHGPARLILNEAPKPQSAAAGGAP